jgi:uncharacterized damage-inducible protein DinB
MEMERDLAPVAEIFALNTDLLINSIDSVSETHGAERVLPGTNSIAFIVAHLVDARFFIAKLLGRAIPNPLEADLGNVQRIEEVTHMPPLSELCAMWIAVSSHVHNCFEEASSELLASDSPQRFPMRDGSVLGGLAFLAQHESYHIGQLSFIRKGLGYPAMSYLRPSDTAART